MRCIAQAINILLDNARLLVITASAQNMSDRSDTERVSALLRQSATLWAKDVYDAFYGLQAAKPQSSKLELRQQIGKNLEQATHYFTMHQQDALLEKYLTLDDMETAKEALAYYLDHKGDIMEAARRKRDHSEKLIGSFLDAIEE